MPKDFLNGTDADRFNDYLDNWADEGWYIEDIIDFLNDNANNATEAMTKVEYFINSSERLISRMTHQWLERINLFEDRFEGWIGKLNNPMNYEDIATQYRDWAKQNRRWELILENSRGDWEAVMMGDERLLILARCDALDESSKPQLNLLLAKLHDPNLFSVIDVALTEIEENEARQKRIIYTAIQDLQSDGYDVENIAELNLVDALKELGHRHKLHNLHEIIRLQIIDEIAEFDGKLAEKYEVERKVLLNTQSEEDLNELSKKISAVSLDFTKRLAAVNLQLAEWEDAGIHFQTSRIEGHEIFEWETNMPELAIEVENHLQLVTRYRYFEQRSEDIVSADQYIGRLEQSGMLAEIVDNLELGWKDAELECYSIVERYQNLGLVMDNWEEQIAVDPINCLKLIKMHENKWQNRLSCIEELLKIDVSFDGETEVEQRINLLREIDAGPEVIDDTTALIERLIKRRTRHRVLLEKELMSLISLGKADENTVTNTLNLAEFEELVAHIRIHGSQTNISESEGTMIRGGVGERIKQKVGDELDRYEAAGWYITELRSMFDSDPLQVARLLSQIRKQMKEHGVLRRRLSNLPWNRNITLALQIQEEMQNPLKLAQLNEQIPAMMKQLAMLPVEDDDFSFSAWAPKKLNKNLSSGMVDGLNDTLDDAHEAILESMEITNVDEFDDETKTIKANVTPSISDDSAKTQQQLPPKKATRDHLAEKPVSAAPPKRKTPQKSANSGDANVEHLHLMMKKLGLSDSYDASGPVADTIVSIRRSLAKHVGIEPRDIRIDRLLRLTLRLLPQGNEHDNQRKLLIMKLASGIKRYENWVKMRLEARHQAAKGSLIIDSKILGKALQRIPGPGFSVPLEKDEKELPPFNDIDNLTKEVNFLLSTMNLDNASGVVVNA